MKKQELVEEILERKSNEETVRDIFTFCEAYDAVAEKYLTPVERKCINYVYGLMTKQASEELYSTVGAEIHPIMRKGINKLAEMFADKKGFKTTLDDDGDVELLTYIKPDSHIATIRIKQRNENEWLDKNIEDCLLLPSTVRTLKKWKFNHFCGVTTIRTVRDLVVLLNTRLVKLRNIPKITDAQIEEIMENPIISSFLYEKTFNSRVGFYMAEELMEII